jgi:hypothetical protein
MFAIARAFMFARRKISTLFSATVSSAMLLV